MSNGPADEVMAWQFHAAVLAHYPTANHHDVCGPVDEAMAYQFHAKILTHILALTLPSNCGFFDFPQKNKQTMYPPKHSLLFMAPGPPVTIPSGHSMQTLSDESLYVLTGHGLQS